jgi:hypothetical protein
MVAETVNTAHPVKEFFNDAGPWFEGRVVLVLIWC